MAFTTTPYCGVGDVKLALGITDTTDDAWLQVLIGEAQAMIDQEVGYPFQTDGTLSVPAVRVYDGNGGDVLAIDDCLSFSQVLETQYNVILGANGVWTQQNPLHVDITADCVLTPNNMSPASGLKRLSGYGFWSALQNYQVSGVFGQPAIPADISRATIRLAVHLFKMRDANYSDQVADGQFGKGIKFIPDMPEDVCRICDRHRHRLFLGR